MQTAYGNNFGTPRPGSLGDSLGDRVIVTGYADVALAFGRFVLASAATKDKFALPAGNLTGLGGVVLATMAIESKNDGLDAGYEANDAANILKRGPVYLKCETAIAKEGAVYIRQTAGVGGEPVGNIRNDADGGKATLSAKVRVLEPLTGAGTVLCWVDVTL